MASNTTRTFPVLSSSCGVPAAAQAYALNITVVPHQTLGYLTLWPTGQPQPLVSTLNSLDGRIVANAAIVPAGTNGSVNVYVSDTTDVIIDINGYFTSSAGSQGLSFYSLTPCRIVDTRGPSGQFGGPIIGAGAQRTFNVPQGPCTVPSGVQAYSLNATVVPPGQLGYLSLWPSAQPQPLVSTLNSPQGAVVANAAIVPAGTGGGVSAFVTDQTQLILDLDGYFAPPGGAFGTAFHIVTPCRVADTRGATGAFGGPFMTGGSARTFEIPQSTCGIPAGAVAYSLNITAVPRGPLNYLSAWAENRIMPLVSTLNSGDGRIVANAAIVPAGTNNGISLFVTNDTDVVIDINGYFTLPASSSFTVNAVYPADQSTGVDPNSGVVLTMSQPVDPSYVNSGNVQLNDGNSNVSGTVSVSDDGLYIVFVPNTPLITRRCTLQVSGVRSALNSFTAPPFTSTFTTNSGSSSPVVASISPNTGATVPTNVQVFIQSPRRLNPASLTSQNTYFQNGGGHAPAAVKFSPDGLSVSITPQRPLSAGASYFLVSPLVDIVKLFVPTNLFFTTSFNTQTQGPAVVSTSPQAGASGIPLNTAPTILFSAPIRASSASAGIQFTSGGNPVSATISVNNAGTLVTITPAALLSPNTAYSISVSSTVADLAGNSLQSPVLAGFTTGTAPDLTAASVIAVNPANDSFAPTNVAIQVLLSKPVDHNSVTATTLALADSNQQNVHGTVQISPNDLVLSFVPQAPLKALTSYSLMIGSLTDLSGVRFQSPGFVAFETNSGPDTTTPSVVSVSPPPGSSGIPSNARVNVRFNKSIDPVTVTAASLRLLMGSTPVPSSLILADNLVILRPLTSLQPSTVYTLQGAGITDVAGNPLGALTSSFTTAVSAVDDNTFPTLVSVAPADRSTGVAVNTPVQITFNKPIDPTTSPAIATSGVILAGTTVVSGPVVTFTPQAPWPGNAQITVSTGSIADYVGHSVNFSTLFTSAPANDTSPPVVTSVTPSDGAVGVTSTIITLTFSKALNPATISGSTILLFNGNVLLQPLIERSADSKSLTMSLFNLPAPATLTVLATHGLTDLVGNPLTDFRSQFSTVVLDASLPAVVTQRPGPGATQIPADTAITLVFSKPVDATSLSNSLHVTDDGLLVPGSVSITEGGQAVVFTPANPFSPGSVVTAFYGGMNSSFTIAGGGVVSFHLDMSSPAGQSTIPTNAVFDLKFNLAVDPSTVNSSTIELVRGGTTNVPATVTLRSPNVVRLTPSSPLTPNAMYFISVTNGLRSVQGLAGANAGVQYTTQAGPDMLAPAVTSVAPTANFKNAGTNYLSRVLFNKPIDPASLDTGVVTLTAGGVPIGASLSVGLYGQSLTITPNTLLPDSASIMVSVTGLEDMVGNSFPAANLAFTTGAGVDTTVPLVIATSIGNAETDVPVNSVISVLFSKPMDGASFNAGTCPVTAFPNQPVAGSYSFSSDLRVFTFTPSSPYPVFSNIQMNCIGLQDLGGNQLFSTFYLQFETSFSNDSTPPTVVAISPDNGLNTAPINSVLQILFSEPVQGSSLAGISLSTSAGPVSASAALSSPTIVTLSPTALLNANTTYTITVTGVRDLGGNTMAGSANSTFTTGSNVDLKNPVITGSVGSSASNVPTNAPLRFMFSERINRISFLSSFHSASVAINVNQPASLTVSSDGQLATATFGNLAPNTPYSYAFTISDLAGNNTELSEAFNTGAGPDTPSFSVLATSPSNGLTGVPVNTLILAQFSKIFDQTTLPSASVVVTGGGNPIPGAVTLAAYDTVRFAPTDLLQPGTTYTVQISGISDLTGHALTPKTFSFSTAPTATPDHTIPSATAINPPDGASGVAVNAVLSVTFSAPLSPLPFDSSVGLTTLSGIAIPGAVNFAGSTFTFTPIRPLPGNTTFNFFANVTDVAGNPGAFNSKFTTAASTDTVPPAVIAVTPLDGATAQPLNTQVVLKFSESIDPATITPSSVALFSGINNLGAEAAHSADGTTILLSSFVLPSSTTITVVATHDLTDLAGNHLSDFTSRFTTGTSQSGQTAVVSQTPANGATNVPATTHVVLQLNAPIMVTTLAGALHIVQNGVVINGTVQTPDAQTITFTPGSPYNSGAFVQVYLDSTALDTTGSPVMFYVGNFTIAGTSGTSMKIQRVNPSSRLLATNSVLEFEFTRDLDPGSVNAADITLLRDGDAIPATVTARTSRVVRLIPTGPIDNAQYVVRFSEALGGLELAFTGRASQPAIPDVQSVVSLASGHTRIQFTAPINPLTIDGSSVQLVGPDGAIIPCSYSFGEGDASVELAPLIDPIPSGLAVRIGKAVEGADGPALGARSITVK